MFNMFFKSGGIFSCRYSFYHRPHVFQRTSPTFIIKQLINLPAILRLLLTNGFESFKKGCDTFIFELLCNKMRPLLRLNNVAIFSKYAVC